MPTSIIVIGVIIAAIISCFTTVQQGTISVITMFGKYRRILPPGLNFRIPIAVRVHNVNN